MFKPELIRPKLHHVLRENGQFPLDVFDVCFHFVIVCFHLVNVCFQFLKLAFT